MRILVISDSHGNSSAMRQVIENNPDAELVVFLGDGVPNFSSCQNLLTGKRSLAVKGNNDFYCDLPKSRIITEDGVNIYMTHGHYEYVKSGLSGLLSEAKKNNCTLALYGHTHIQKADYCDGIHLFCPGTLMCGSYGIVEITDGNISCIGTKLK